MSYDAWGDDGQCICECECCATHHQDSLVEGWERAIDHIASKIDRIASMIDGYLGHDGSDTQVSARALAMTVRAMKPWAREGRA